SVFRFTCFFFSSRRRHTRCLSDWSSDVCSSDLFWCGNPDLAGSRYGSADGSGSTENTRRGQGYRTRTQSITRCIVRQQCPSQNKIGRASCRERVDVSVGVVVRKNKKWLVNPNGF